MADKLLKKKTPLDISPLYIKAGSIVPMGQFMQYATEKPADCIELRIYPGANGSFTLYEDENDNYNYEKGAFSTIRFNWDNAAKTLEILSRKGEFNGMLKQRVFNVVLVDGKKGTGLELSTAIDKVVRYNGTKQVIKL